jgi:hypothetical protein
MAVIHAEIIVCSDMSDIRVPPRYFDANVDATGYSHHYAPGRLPSPQFVLKVHCRCDPACDHCYVYERTDPGWRDIQRSMICLALNIKLKISSEDYADEQIGSVHRSRRNSPFRSTPLPQFG